jgi:hypothetical protein
MISDKAVYGAEQVRFSQWAGSPEMIDVARDLRWDMMREAV